ncbi:hypothetical protein OG819_00910 [Streptomyces sp. NBC_01549]|uniref:hypothetical protein n=1 Tax=Streptomyces sp. NBC_01549 TaxID=2975874 RepID=UPI002257DB62|nr:hypothetical protein [Streptomyces sp. NBC_01549]MCX4588352.1 hypothetical protein [Streptomyces sp. NBC_01549]
MPGRHGDPEPSQQFSDEQIVNWLIDECRDVGNRISALTTSGDRILTAGSTVIALLATVAIGGGKGYLLMWLPLGVSVVTVYALFLNNLTRALVGYKIGLEKEIEKRAGLPLIAWQSRINVGAGSSHHVKSILIMAVAVYAGSAGLGLSQALHTLEPGAWGHERAWLYIVLTSVSILAGTAVAAYCLWIQRGTRKATEQRVGDMFADGGRADGS